MSSPAAKKQKKRKPHRLDTDSRTDGQLREDLYREAHAFDFEHTQAEIDNYIDNWLTVNGIRMAPKWKIDWCKRTRDKIMNEPVNYGLLDLPDSSALENIIAQIPRRMLVNQPRPILFFGTSAFCDWILSGGFENAGTSAPAPMTVYTRLELPYNAYITASYNQTSDTQSETVTKDVIEASKVLYALNPDRITSFGISIFAKNVHWPEVPLNERKDHIQFAQTSIEMSLSFFGTYATTCLDSIPVSHPSKNSLRPSPNHNFL